MKSRAKKHPTQKQVKFRVGAEEWQRLEAETKRRKLRSVPALARSVTMRAVEAEGARS